MKKKSYLVSLLLLSAILTGCSSEVSEKDLSILKDRVSALEQGFKQVESKIPKDVVETTANKDTDVKKNEKPQISGGVITSKEGIELSFAGGGIIEEPKKVLGAEKEEQGVHYVYTILDWKYTGTEQSYAFGYYDIALTDGEITIGDSPFINYESVIDKLKLEGVKTLPTPLSPKETGKTVMVFKISDTAYKEANFWMLKFDGQDGAIEVAF